MKAAADNLAAAEEHAAAITQALTLWSERLATLDRLGKDLGGKAAERADAAGRVADLRISAAEAKRAARKRGGGGDDASASSPPPAGAGDPITAEEIEAYRLKRARAEDPMARGAVGGAGEGGYEYV